MFPSDSNSFAPERPEHGLRHWYSAEGYAPHVVRLWNHAGTSVGNGVGRTPQRRECGNRLSAKGKIGPCEITAPVDGLLAKGWGNIHASPT
jgi:hypothetical protein